MTIALAFAAIPNSTCRMRQGQYPQGGQHVKDCERCAAIRAFGWAVAMEAGHNPGAKLRAQIEALGK